MCSMSSLSLDSAAGFARCYSFDPCAVAARAAVECSAVDPQANAVRYFVKGGLAGFTGNMPAMADKYARQLRDYTYFGTAQSARDAIERECFLVVKGASEEEFAQKCKELSDPQRIKGAVADRIQAEIATLNQIRRQRDIIFNPDFTDPSCNQDFSNGKLQQSEAVLRKAEKNRENTEDLITKARAKVTVARVALAAAGPDDGGFGSKAMNEFCKANIDLQNAERMFNATQAAFEIAEQDFNRDLDEYNRLDDEIVKILKSLGMESLDDTPNKELVEARIASENEATIAWLKALRQS